MRIVPHILGAAIAAALISTPVFAAELTGTLKKIKESGTITLGHRDASIPFSYIADGSGKPVGYSHDIQLAIVKAVEKDLGMKEGFDVGLEMSGIESAFQQMINNMMNGGKIALLGIPAGGKMDIDWNQVIFKGLIIKGIYGREMYETWYKMTAMIQSGLDISPVITHRLKIDDYIEGFEAMKSGQCGKVILDWE